MVKIKDGKLYENGKEVKPEFGNPDHIKALREAGAYKEAGEIDDTGEIECDDYTERNVSFECFCGQELSATFTVEYDDTAVECQEMDCHECKREYELREDLRGNITAKMVKHGK